MHKITDKVDNGILGTYRCPYLSVSYRNIGTPLNQVWIKTYSVGVPMSLSSFYSTLYYLVLFQYSNFRIYLLTIFSIILILGYVQHRDIGTVRYKPL